MHERPHIVCVFLWIVSMWSSSWQWLHFHRTELQPWPGISPQGSSLSILNHHRGPTLSLAPPPVWAPAPLSLHSKGRRTDGARGRKSDIPTERPKTINFNQWTLCPNMVHPEQSVPVCLGLPLSYWWWLYLITTRLPRMFIGFFFLT